MQKLAEICVRRPVFATVIILALTVIGGFSFFTLGVDRFPKIDIPTVSVSTTNPGAAPAEVESEITDVIEGAVNTATGIDELRSSSTTGPYTVLQLTDLAQNQIVKRIQSAYGVGEVFIFGARQRQINIHLDPTRMR